MPTITSGASRHPVLAPVLEKMLICLINGLHQMKEAVYNSGFETFLILYKDILSNVISVSVDTAFLHS